MSIALFVDVSSYIHSAYFAAASRNPQPDDPSNGLAIAIKMLRTLINRTKPMWVATVFDTEGETYRHTLYSQYKAHRPPKDQQLVEYIRALRLICGAMGLNPIEVKPYEADDVLASLANLFSKQNIFSYIATPDKDLAAVVSDSVSLISKAGDVMAPDDVIQRFGVAPLKMTDLLAMKGDPVDNIPGIHNCGYGKGAILLNTYGTLEKIIDAADEITYKFASTLKAQRNQLIAMRDVIKLKTDVPIWDDLRVYRRRPLNKERLLELFEEFQLFELHEKLRAAG